MKMMNKTSCKTLSVLALSAAMFVNPVGADDNAGTKLFRGLAGVVCAFLEVPGNMTQIARKDSIPEGLTEGLFKGVLMMGVRSFVGGYEIITFPFPIKNYKPVLEPTYPWGYFGNEEDSPAAPAAAQGK